MNETPTPDQARDALRDVRERRRQATEAAAWPRWWWIGGGAFLIVLGVVFELSPGFARTWGTIIVCALLTLAAISTTRRGHALTGRQVGVGHRPAPANWGVAILAALLLTAVVFVASKWNLPHVGVIVAVVGGVLMAVAGPWWERRVIERRTAGVE